MKTQSADYRFPKEGPKGIPSFDTAKMKYQLTSLSLLLLTVASLSFQPQSFIHTHHHHATCNLNTKFSHDSAPLSKKSATCSTSTGRKSSSTALMAIPASSLLTAAPSLAISSALPSIPTSITSPLGSVAVLALVILIHELGHFSAARSFNINVEEFSVGVGPKLFGFTRNVVTGKIDFRDKSKSSEDMEEEDAAENSDEIEFNLRAIPLGGYVRFPENYNTTQGYQMEVAADKKRQEINKIIQKNRAKNSQDEGLIASVTNIVEQYTNKNKQKEERLLALEIMTNELNDENKKSKTTSSWFTNPFSGNGKKKQQEEKDPLIIIEEDGTVSTQPIEYYNDPNLLQNRGWQQRAVVLAGGVVFNLLLAFTLYFGELTVGGGMSRPSFDQGIIVNTYPRSDGPSAGILNRGDVILALNGQTITSGASPTIYTSQETISAFISKIRATTPGDSLHMTVMDSETKKISNVDIKPEPMTKDDPTTPLSLGVMIGPNYKGQEMIKATNVIDAISIAATEVSESTSQNARSILSYLGTVLQGKSGAATGQSLSGPIGVIKAGSDVVSTNDVTAVIGFAAAISINLAVVNALPLPALDGGQMLFVISEAVTGRKVDQRLQETINSTALLFLLFVTFSTAIGDISKIAVK